MVTTLPGMTFRIEDVAGRMPDAVRWELVRGELHMMTPAGGDHGRVTMEIGSLLHQFVKARKLGVVLGADPGFILGRNPDTLLAPDVAFVAKRRAGSVGAGFVDGPPDLAVEVVSPSQSDREAMDKAQVWLRHGAQLVWIIQPADRSVTVLNPDSDPLRLTDSDTLTGDPLLPGFSCPVSEIFG